MRRWQQFLHQWVEQEQCAVQVVSNGAEAQQLASHQPYDLVILDLHLPGAGGLDVLRAGGNRDGRRHGRRARPQA
jgi:two-component system, OmpR family, manganese sensing response regulator